jgi:putative transposase
MKILKAYKFRLKTNREIEPMLWKISGHCRFVWNYFWRMNQRRLEQKHRILGYYEMDHWSKWLKASEEYGFLKEVPAQVLQQKLKDLDRAYQDGFDRAQIHKRMPTLRKRFVHSSFRFPTPNQLKLEPRRIFLPKLGWLSFFQSQKIEGCLRNATVSYSGGYWWISIQVEEDQAFSKAPEIPVGIDLGIVQFATCVSEAGEIVYAPKAAYREHEAKLALAQRKLKHKQKFSKNWNTQKRRIQKIHRKVVNARNDFLHRISTEICKNHAKIFVEDLKVANMSRSAKGTIENPGKQVSQKSGLNKSILDQGWREFRRQLEYKSAWRKGVVTPIEPHYSSQTCSCCGYRDAQNRVSQAKFHCRSCGWEGNADSNAARNLLAAGLRRVGL